MTLSPMMLQWQACKKKAGGALLLFRLGDFYEAFEEDAEALSKALDVVLTKRQETPMAGIPVHACESYIDRLVDKGFRVAIAEQMEDPRATKGLVKREVVRVITPGTVINSQLLVEKRHNFLACLTQMGAIFGLAVLDLTTADFRVMEFETSRAALDTIAQLSPKELFISERCWKGLSERPSVAEMRKEWHFDPRVAYERLLKQFGVHSLDGFGLKGMTAAVSAAGALVAYVKEELNLSLAHVRIIQPEYTSSYMSLDQTTVRHLELDHLLSILDETKTPMGGRLLKEWLLHPLLSVQEIEKRQEKISQLLHAPAELGALLKEVRDLERLIMRIETGYASPRDLIGLGLSLKPLEALSRWCGPLPKLGALAEKIEKALVEAPPLRISEGGIFKTGFHAELDTLRSLKSESQSWMINYQGQLREETAIKTLKVGYTQAFGYYIEVSRGQAGKMPDRFQRRQTLVNAERFTTPELKEYEHKILTAEMQIIALETALFHELRKEISLQAEAIRTAARQIAQTDCLLSLAQVAKKRRYCRPVVDESKTIEIEEGRHPVIEASLSDHTFISNDTKLGHELCLITGPNMAGKSTYIRQVALIAVLAQMGAYVPAKQAHIGIVDKLFSRIGASDDLSRGQSTFMVEMSETANILHNATHRSLVILDEIGRGTSTYDGISIAWAVAEHLMEMKVRTLFATHYFELTEMKGAVNFHVAVHESEKGIVFLRKIVPGSTDKSYGIHVAKLAGLPDSVIRRAQELLADLHCKAEPPPGETQLELF